MAKKENTIKNRMKIFVNIERWVAIPRHPEYKTQPSQYSIHDSKGNYKAFLDEQGNFAMVVQEEHRVGPGRVINKFDVRTELEQAVRLAYLLTQRSNG